MYDSGEVGQQIGLGGDAKPLQGWKTKLFPSKEDFPLELFLIKSKHKSTLCIEAASRKKSLKLS